ncbi:MAG: tetratricopeptide repeat protein [Spirochaetaceae bacterium]|jgi:tetratricopeptide (TPR) repeat protein|nr:tetratricopeptide repeat protein [Spirochaetaceae bacterium]
MTNSSKTGIRFVALFFAFTMLMAVVAGAQDSQQTFEWDYYYKRALNRRYQGDYAGAIADINVVIRLQPDNSEFYNARGIIYEKSGDYASAMADYEWALSVNPDSAEAVHNIRNLNARLAPPVDLTGQSAAGQDNTAVGVTPQPVQDNFYSQPSALRQGAYGGSGSTPQPVRYDPYSRPGIVSFFPEQHYSPPDAPISTQDSFVTSNYGHTVFIYRNVTAQPALNLPSDTRTAVSVTAKTVASNTAAGTTGRLHEVAFSQRQPLQAPQSGVNGTARDGKTQAPADTSAQNILIDPVAEIYNKYGAALYGHGLYDEAILQFNEAVKTYPKYAIAYNNRGLAFAAKGDMASAAADFDQALRINPYYYDAQFNRAMVMNTAPSQ